MEGLVGFIVDASRIDEDVDKNKSDGTDPMVMTPSARNTMGHCGGEGWGKKAIAFPLTASWRYPLETCEAAIVKETDWPLPEANVKLPGVIVKLDGDAVQVRATVTVPASKIGDGRDTDMLWA